jgi:CobQ-like glutamine amidotransferase family enzyme
MAYHTKPIPKGTLGEFSKITEEFLELQDAADQQHPVLQICEMCDLIGAIEAYAKKYNLTLVDLIQMKESTRTAFRDGQRRA